MATQSTSRWARPHLGWQTWREYVRLNWHYRVEGKRDLRLDFLRGLCVCIMVIDHIGGFSLLRSITGNNSFFVSAAEGFVFISGLLFGQIYRTIIERHGFRAAVGKAWSRARTLYTLTFVLTLILAYGSWLVGTPWVSNDELGAPLQFMWHILTLQRSYPFTDILVLYTLLIIGSPLALWLLDRGWTNVLIAGSWALWLLYQIAPERAAQPLPTIQSFHPAAWQIFWVHAMALGFHRARVAAWLHEFPRGRLIAGLSVVFAVLITIYGTRGAIIDPIVPGNVQEWLGAVFNKNPVRIGRIIAAIVVFPLAYLAATYLWRPLHEFAGKLLLPLGQNSLYSYIMHLPLMIVLAVIIGWPDGNTWAEQLFNMALQATAIGALWLMIRHRWLFRIVPQ